MESQLASALEHEVEALRSALETERARRAEAEHTAEHLARLIADALAREQQALRRLRDAEADARAFYAQAAATKADPVDSERRLLLRSLRG